MPGGWVLVPPEWVNRVAVGSTLRPPWTADWPRAGQASRAGQVCSAEARSTLTDGPTRLIPLVSLVIAQLLLSHGTISEGRSNFEVHTRLK